MSGSPPVLFGPDNRPLASTAVRPYGHHDVARMAAGFRGHTFSNWIVNRTTRFEEKWGRRTLVDRAEDLVANDPHAASSIGSIAVNTVGTGFKAQSRPNAKVLGWNEDQTKAFQEQAEWTWHIFQQESDAAGRLTFSQDCFVAIQTLLTCGEFFRVPVMIKRPGKVFSLALQAVHPLRFYTPSDLTQRTDIREGIEFGRFGMPRAYWAADPIDGCIDNDLPSGAFTRVPAVSGHRPGCFHNFVARTEEQMRGVSVLAPGMKFFRDLNDYLDFELIGAIVAAQFPVFIETHDPHETADTIPGGTREENARSRYNEVEPGSIYYGNINERPHILKSERPANSFDAFVERNLRAIGASIGMPYEVVSKDFSKVNYSSARAALLEAWRVFGLYQRWMVDGYCQPVWGMALEEAWLRGMIKLPKSAPDFYDATHAYVRANWIPPRKGHVDPLKEIMAYIKAKNENLGTAAVIAAELFGEDWEAIYEQRAREKAMERELDILPGNEKKPAATVKEPAHATE
ncbi:MAG: phage portal protein [Desulfobacterales bacterium]|nr:phage portal protein [Desulfobacterales bacterium]